MNADANSLLDEATRHHLAVAARDIAAVGDALHALVSTAYALAAMEGIDLGPVIAEVHAANLTKLDADGRPLLRSDGKVLKGPNYRLPDVAGVLRRSKGLGTP